MNIYNQRFGEAAMPWHFAKKAAMKGYNVSRQIWKYQSLWWNKAFECLMTNRNEKFFPTLEDQKATDWQIVVVKEENIVHA